jgi:glycosyltransferase involved in cell wall biosynthesis
LEEPFGRVPFEALLAGSLPIVPTESGGSEYLAPLFPDSIYPTQNAGALATRLMWAEKLSDTERKNLLERGRQWVIENLDWETITNQISFLYRKAIQESDHQRLIKSRSDWLLRVLNFNRIHQR